MMNFEEAGDDRRFLLGPGPWTKSMGPGPPPAPASAYGLAVLFGSAAVAHLFLTISAILEWKPVPCAELVKAKHSQPLDVSSLPSVHALLREMTRLGSMLGLCWLAEHSPPYPHLEKIYDRDLYWMVTAQLFLVALATWRKVPHGGSDILNREQTEEWKGWMQFSFLMYHYFHAEDTYNAIRVMITCYVWMTGFGNFSFFYIKRDFGAIRLLQMLWRLNFLVLFLCLTFGNTYILYYICPLHTCFFLVVYVTMRIYPEVNHTQWGIRYKLAVLGLLVYAVWDLPFTRLFDLFFGWWMDITPTIGATLGPRWEWYFRSSLDHWSTFLGMIFALNYPAAKQWMAHVETQLSSSTALAVKGAAATVISGLLFWWYTSVFSAPKLEYNASNAYLGCIPLLGYVFLRNLTPWLRSHYAQSLHELGKVTLETYLLQHHIWLTSNAKTLLCLIPNRDWRACNMLLATVLYYFASRELFRLTMALRGMLLPSTNLSQCWRNLGGLSAALTISWVIGVVVKSAVTARTVLFVLVLSSLVGGGSVCALLIFRRKVTTPFATLKSAAGLTTSIAVVGFLILWIYLSERYGPEMDDGEEKLGTPSVADARKSVTAKAPGAMAQPLMGLGILAVSVLMLATMDSYFGIPMIALRIVSFGRASVRWSDAYEPLHAEIGVEPTLPTNSTNGMTKKAGTIDSVGESDIGKGMEASDEFPTAETATLSASSNLDITAEQKKPLL